MWRRRRRRKKTRSKSWVYIVVVDDLSLNPLVLVYYYQYNLDDFCLSIYSLMSHIHERFCRRRVIKKDQQCINFIHLPPHVYYLSKFYWITRVYRTLTLSSLTLSYHHKYKSLSLSLYLEFGYFCCLIEFLLVWMCELGPTKD